jgi:hypothetical protein
MQVAGQQKNTEKQRQWRKTAEFQVPSPSPWEEEGKLRIQSKSKPGGLGNRLAILVE